MKHFRGSLVVVAVLILLGVASSNALAQVPTNLHYPPRTIGELNKMAVSSFVYGVYRRHLSAPGALPTVASDEPTVASGPGKLITAANRAPIAVAPYESVISQGTITMDAAVDVEPAIIKQTNSTGSGTIIVHMKYDTNGLSNFYYYTTANGNAPAKLDPPAYYTQTGDPFLTESQLDSGQSQRRVYLTGLVTNFPFTWAVAVWHSDNLGQSWTLGTNLLAAGTSDLDKPTCDVSHHSGSAGYLFVAYRKILYGTTHEIHVARSTDGGNSFDQDVVVASSTNVLNVANVVVSSSSGYVYVNWVDFSANPQKLYLARSQYAGSLSGTWTPDSSGPTGYFFVNTGDYMNGNLRGMTVPMMRHNWPAGKLSLVWHEKEASGSHLADVYYAAYTTSGWQSKVKISNESPNCGSSHTDQFMPALDHDSNGDVLVTYYDRQNNCSNSEYRLYFTKITSSGSQLQAPTDARAVRPRRLSRGVTTNVPM